MGGYPALSIRPPENPLDMYARVFQIKHLQQASQAQDIQNRMLEETYADDQRLRSVSAQGANHPEWPPEDYIRAAQEQSVGPQGMAWLRQTAIQSQQALSSLGQEQLKVLDGVNSKLQGLYPGRAGRAGRGKAPDAATEQGPGDQPCNQHARA